MAQRHTLIGLVTFLSACSGPSYSQQSVPLQKILDDPKQWIGKTVTIDGWLVECGGYDCIIVPSRDDVELVRAPHHPSPGQMAAFYKRMVSIGYNEAFDKQAGPLQGQHVLLRAKVNRDPRTVGCFDRCDNLLPISVRPFTE